MTDISIDLCRIFPKTGKMRFFFGKSFKSFQYVVESAESHFYEIQEGFPKKLRKGAPKFPEVSKNFLEFFVAFQGKFQFFRLKFSTLGLRRRMLLENAVVCEKRSRLLQNNELESD